MCPGQIVTFMCVTRGTLILNWASKDYIGDRNLEISDRTRLNERVLALGNNSTFATLVNDTMEDSTRVFVSQLRIIVSSVSLTPSVTCINDADKRRATIRFRVPGI